MFDRPSCPNCRSNLLVGRIRTHGYPRTKTKKKKAYYRCFRCFGKFTPEDSDPAVPEANGDLWKIVFSTSGRFARCIQHAVPIRVEGLQQNRKRYFVNRFHHSLFKYYDEFHSISILRQGYMTVILTSNWQLLNLESYDVIGNNKDGDKERLRRGRQVDIVPRIA